MSILYYRAGYKYQVMRDYQQYIPIHPLAPITTAYIDLDTDGKLTIRAGYAWDGATATSNPKTSRRGGLVHDALYQLTREGHLAAEYRAVADWIFYQCLVKDGMSRLRAWCWYQVVRWAAGPCARPSGGRPVLAAP